MNYFEHVEQTFQLYGNDGQHVSCYLSDRDGINVQEFVLPNNKYYYDYTKDELDYYVCNQINQNPNSVLSTLDLVGYSIGAYEDLYFISSNKVDFYSFSCSITSFNVTACRVNDGIENANYDDYYNIENYSYISSNGIFSTGSNEGQFYKVLQNGQFTIFDYSSVNYDNVDYLSDTSVIRGENVSLYNIYFHINDFSNDNVYISFGKSYQSYYTSGYSTGYGNGFSSGYVKGQEIGFQNGVNSNGVNNQTANAFSYIGQAFNACGRFLGIEVLPNITLGMCFSIPMIFVLIITIFKLVRK